MTKKTYIPASLTKRAFDRIIAARQRGEMSALDFLQKLTILSHAAAAPKSVSRLRMAALESPTYTTPCGVCMASVN